MRRPLVLLTKGSLLAATLAAPAIASAPAASARCLEAGQTYYTITNVVVSRRLSNLGSDWVAAIDVLALAKITGLQLLETAVPRTLTVRGPLERRSRCGEGPPAVRFGP